MNIKSINQLREEFDEKFPLSKVTRSPQLQSLFEFLQDHKYAIRVQLKPYIKSLLRAYMDYDQEVCADYANSCAL